MLATTNIEARTGRFREDAIDGEYYEHMDYVSYMVDNAVAAITEAAEYADAWAHDEPFPDCKHEHYDPNGRRMYGNCQDDEWGMTYGGNND